ncbi:YfiR family protein [Telluria aromaticivorans]|uniref:YfiR family protein n=1 Tax=Telluria aromaticivorans TaxID=2725995 RepID=A0A7Y2K0S7_9BURK|nr:YfiR family protein [Telluria aromaticivorans]NNG23314.1 YfiR family protein [Telluria aromaticivorans]
MNRPGDKLFAMRMAKLLVPLLVPVLFALAWLAAGAAQAQFGAPTEEAVKAAYLSKLRHYVEWPARAAPPAGTLTVIGIIGADEVADNLMKLSSVRDPAKATLAVRRLRGGDSLDGIHILYVGDAWFARSSAMVGQAGARSILVVSETEGALARGSVINFHVADERIRFDISLESAAKSGLKISSQLLALAANVVREK